MAALVTLAELRTRALQRANMENTQFITTAEANQVVNTNAYKLWNRLARAVPRYFSKDFAIVTVPSQVAYPFPPDFHSVQAVYAIEQNDRWRPLRNLTDTQRQVFRPPQGNYQVTLRYTPTFTKLVTDSDTLDGVAGLDELIVLGAARDFLIKEQNEAGPVVDEMRELMVDVMSFGTNRDIGQPEYVTEVEDYEDWPYPYAQAVNAYQIRAGGLDLYSVAPVWP